jgi:hypothetical protein
MFGKAPDFEASERVIVEPHQRQPIRILSYCVLTNNRPEKNGFDERSRTSVWGTPSVRKAGHVKRANPRPIRQGSYVQDSDTRNARQSNLRSG